MGAAAGKNEQGQSGKAASGEWFAELLMAAHCYQLPSLVALCVEHLAPTLTVDNFVTYLLLADTRELPELTECCLDFVRAEPARLAGIMDSEGWTQLGRHHVDQLLASFIPAGLRRKPRQVLAAATSSLQEVSGPASSHQVCAHSQSLI